MFNEKEPKKLSEIYNDFVKYHENIVRINQVIANNYRVVASFHKCFESPIFENTKQWAEDIKTATTYLTKLGFSSLEEALKIMAEQMNQTRKLYL